MNGGRKFSAVLLGVGLALAGGASSAEAHLVTTGLGPIYDGIGHFFLTPEDVIANPRRLGRQTGDKQRRRLPSW